MVSTPITRSSSSTGSVMVAWQPRASASRAQKASSAPVPGAVQTCSRPGGWPGPRGRALVGVVPADLQAVEQAGLGTAAGHQADPALGLGIADPGQAEAAGLDDRTAHLVQQRGLVMPVQQGAVAGRQHPQRAVGVVQPGLAVGDGGGGLVQRRGQAAHLVGAVGQTAAGLALARPQAIGHAHQVPQGARNQRSSAPCRTSSVTDSTSR
jgi:hypothetical protein